MDWLPDAYLVLTLLVLVALSFLLGYNVQKNEADACYLSNELWNRSMSNGGRIIGLASGHIFCVDTEGRHIEDVLDTCAHEYAHTEEGMKD